VISCWSDSGPAQLERSSSALANQREPAITDSTAHSIVAGAQLGF